MRVLALACAWVVLLVACTSTNEDSQHAEQFSRALNPLFDKMTDCGLIEGRFGVSWVVFEPEEECIFECMVALECSALESTICDDAEESYRCLDECDSFTCGDGEVIELCDYCNGETHCADGSDEASCTDQFIFVCGNGTRIRTEFLCDDHDDCGDNSDESIDCTVYDFECDDGSLVDDEAWCDGEEDCPNGSDERDCPSYVCVDGEDPEGLFP